MAKREFITREATIKALNADFNITGKENMEVVVDYINGVYNKINSIPTITEKDIVRPYLEKLKYQIHEKSFESSLMSPIFTYTEIMSMIDNLSKQGDTE